MTPTRNRTAWTIWLLAVAVFFAAGLAAPQAAFAQGDCNEDFFMDAEDINCPGPIVITWAGATPNRPMLVLFSTVREGTFVIPPGLPCAGQRLCLGPNPQIGGRVNSGANGSGQIQGDVPPSACDGELQLFIPSTCEMSDDDNF